MFKVMKEITIWDTKVQPNFTYLVMNEDSNELTAIAYQKKNKEITYFTTPLKIPIDSRRFIKTNKNDFDIPRAITLILGDNQ